MNIKGSRYKNQSSSHDGTADMNRTDQQSLLLDIPGFSTKHNMRTGTGQKTYPNGTPHGQLSDTDTDMLLAELSYFSLKRLEDGGYCRNRLGRFGVDFLAHMDEGLLYVGLLHLFGALFIAFCWFLLSRVQAIKDELTEQDFTGAFYPVVFLIAMIAVENFNTSIKRASESGRKYADLLGKIHQLAIVVYMQFCNAYGVTSDKSGVLVHNEFGGSVERIRHNEDWLRYAEATRTALLENLLVMTYYSYDCFCDYGSLIDSNYFQFHIYRGESALYDDVAMDSDIVYQISPHNSTAMIYQKANMMFPNDDYLKDSGLYAAYGIWHIKRFDVDGTKLESEDFQGMPSLHCREHVWENLRKIYTIKELAIMEMRLSGNFAIPGCGRGIYKLGMADSFRTVLAATENIMNLFSGIGTDGTHAHTVQQHATEVFGYVMGIWAERVSQKHPIYRKIFHIIIWFYLFAIVPMQVLSNVNGFWALFIIPIIIMIYMAPIVVSDWLATPFTENKEVLHVPYRQHRGDLCEEITSIFGLQVKAVYATSGKLKI